MPFFIISTNESSASMNDISSFFSVARMLANSSIKFGVNVSTNNGQMRFEEVAKDNIDEYLDVIQNFVTLTKPEVSM